MDLPLSPSLPFSFPLLSLFFSLFSLLSAFYGATVFYESVVRGSLSLFSEIHPGFASSPSTRWNIRCRIPVFASEIMATWLNCCIEFSPEFRPSVKYPCWDWRILERRGNTLRVSLRFFLTLASVCFMPTRVVVFLLDSSTDKRRKEEIWLNGRIIFASGIGGVMDRGDRDPFMRPRRAVKRYRRNSLMAFKGDYG